MEAARKLWEELDRETRTAAAEAFWRYAGNDDIRKRAFTFLEERLGEPVSELERRSDSWLASRLARHDDVPADVAKDALVLLHVRPRKAMLERFLDEAGIEHKDGIRPPGQQVAYDPAVARRAIDVLRREFPARDVDLYFRTLLAAEGHDWDAWRESFFPSGSRPLPSAGAERAAEPAPAARGTFDTLDHVVLRAVLDSVAGTEGALDAAGARKLVDELVRLNADRHRSYFHRGFLDSAQGRTLDLVQQDLTAPRRRWYLLGALDALVHRDRLAEASDLMARQSADFKELGREAHPACKLAIPLYLRVLAKAGTPAALLAYADAGALASCEPSVRRELLDRATDLLREERLEEAAPLLEALSKASVGDRPEFRWDVQRRRAHARRLAGDAAGARAFLEEILEGGAGDHAPMVLADLGLVACGLRSLADVKLPREDEELDARAVQLEPGLEFFRRSVEAPGRRGHGEFCLGVYHLCRREPKSALPLLERALAAMQQSPATYERGGILARARFYVGYCLAEGNPVLHADRVRALVESAAQALRHEALHWFGEVLTFLSVGDPEAAVPLARSLFATLGDPFVDAIAQAQLLRRLPESRRALRARAEQKTRPRGARFDDFKRLLEASNRAGDAETAEYALDQLELLARDEPERGRFLAIAADPDLYGAAWDRDDADAARVRLHEERGEIEPAKAILEGIAHRRLSAADADALEECRGILERIRAYGLEADAALAARVGALERAELPPSPSPAASPEPSGRVFLLGGNEVQERYDTALRAWAKERWHGVTLDIEHPGWSSNWGRQIGEIESRIARADVVVLLRFVRTLFGRAVRKACSEHGKPWVACTGHGLASLQRAVERAVDRLAGPRASP
jgi:hypothetical protein